MNDGRPDGSTPGPSPVEAYEEDWYRSLRALAERRRSEFGEDEDEPEGQPASVDDRSSATAPTGGRGTPAPSTERASIPAPAADEGGEIEAADGVPIPEPPPPGPDIWAAREVEKRRADEGARRADGTDLRVAPSGPGELPPASESPGDDAEPPQTFPRLDAPEAPDTGRPALRTPFGEADAGAPAGETASLEPPDGGPSEDASSGEAPAFRVPVADASRGDALPIGVGGVEAPSGEGRRPADRAVPAPSRGVDDAEASLSRPGVDDVAAPAPSPGAEDVAAPAMSPGAEDVAASAMSPAADDVEAPTPPWLRVLRRFGSTQPGAADARDEGRALDEEEAAAEAIDASEPSAPAGFETGDVVHAGEQPSASPSVGEAPVGEPPSAADDSTVASPIARAAAAEPAAAEPRPAASIAGDAPAAGRAVDLGPPPQPEPTGPSLTSRDPAERRAALAELSGRDATSAELDTVATLILDPDPDIRRLALETLADTPARLDDGIVRQALQDPADEVRAAAVRAAATRGIRDLPTLAPLVEARRSPDVQWTVLELLPKILGEAQLTADTLDPLLLAIAQMQPPPDDRERAALSEIAGSISAALLIDGLTLPDARRLGAVRLLASDDSPAVLHALAERAGDPLEEVRRAGLAAAKEIERIEEAAARDAGPPDIGALAEELRSADDALAERARATLREADRADLTAWCRDRLARGDADSVALVASVAAVLDVPEIGVELLTRAASLPPERRRPVVDALAGFHDQSRLAGHLAVVPAESRADAVRLLWDAAGRKVLPELRILLADPDVDVRVAVVEIARDADDPASIEAVAGLLATDASPDVRAAAVRTVAANGNGLPHVVRALDDPDPNVRATAVESLPGSPAAEVGAVLAQAVMDVDERVRIAAIERLAGVSSRDPALAWSALQQSRPEERTELLNAFQRSNPSQVLELALEHLHAPDQQERTLAVEMTGWGGSQGAVEAAIRALGDPVPEVRRAAVAALGRLRDRSAVAALGKTLADPDPDVRIGAVRALGVIDDEAVLSFLVGALKDPDIGVRETTSHVLTEWSSPAVAKRLAGVLAVPSLRDSAADLLRRIGPTSVELLIDVLLQSSPDLRPIVGPLLEQIVGIDEFLGRLDSLEPERRLRAIEALGAIAGPLAIDALLRSLSDPDERIRTRAAQLLGELGDPIAADAVRNLVDDPVPEVAAAARRALETSLDASAHDGRA